MTISRSNDLPTIEPPVWQNHRVIESKQYGPSLWMRAEVIEDVDENHSNLEERTVWYRHEFNSTQQKWQGTYLGVKRPEFEERSVSEVSSMLDTLISSDETAEFKKQQYQSLLVSLAWHQEPETDNLRCRTAMLYFECERKIEDTKRARLHKIQADAARGLSLSKVEIDEYRTLADYFEREEH